MLFQTNHKHLGIIGLADQVIGFEVWILKTTNKNFDQKITETFVYMKFLPISKLLLASNKVSLCAFKVRLTEYDEIERWIFLPRKRLPSTITLNLFRDS